MKLGYEQKVVWEAQPGPQTALIACPTFEVLFGGARGGGKTEGSIGDWLDHSDTCGEHASGIFFRKKFKQLEDVIKRTRQIFPYLGAKYNEQKAEWRMATGATLRFRYLERDSDAEEYQGHSYSRVYVEEVTNFASPAPVNLLRATVRSAYGLPTGLRLTGNPGGPGHHWVKARFIAPAPQGWVILREEVAGLGDTKLELERVFIPSKISDNIMLMRNDPYYVARLRQAGSEALVKAWLEGNWDIVDGAFFDCWDERKNVLDTSQWLGRIPKYATRFRAMDWGSSRPFCVGWYAVSDGTWGLPVGAILKYREWYGWTGKPNEGIKWNADTVGKGVLALEAGENIAYGAADPSIFVRNGGPSIGEVMAQVGCFWRRADNKRIPGWVEMRRVISGAEGVPMFYALDCCDNTLRTIPVMQHDEREPEDLDSDMEDHPVDETRYAIMSRRNITYAPTPYAVSYPKRPDEMTINELVARNTARRLREEA